MKKFVVGALCSLAALTAAHAQNWSAVRSGAMVRVGGSAIPALFFYGAAAEKLTFQNLNSATTPLYCGVATLSNPNALLASGTGALAFTAPSSDLYVSVCLSQTTQVTDVILGAFTQAFYAQQANGIEQPAAVAHDADPVLDAQVLDAMRLVIEKR